MDILVPHNLGDLVAEARRLYEFTYPLDAPRRREATAEFERFYAMAATTGLRGIRWNFNGCVICHEHEAPVGMRRVLIVHPAVIEAAHGRALGTVLCGRHQRALRDPVVEEALVAGALKRVEGESADHWPSQGPPNVTNGASRTQASRETDPGGSHP